MPVAPARLLALRAVATLALAAALARAVLGVWFTNEVIPVENPDPAPLAAPGARVLLIVIDGLRHDTALETGAMPRLQALARSGASGVALAPEVTMTATGVRALGTGVAPSMSDLVRYGAVPPVDYDNLFARLHARGGRVALVGDPAWQDSFGPWIDEDDSDRRAITLLQLLDNVNAADRHWVPRAVGLMARRDWQLAIVMLGGIDHASHRFTPTGAEFLQKAAATDEDIARIVAAAGPDTTVIVTSDHGAGARGHHGSGEPEARRTPLVLAGPGIARGVRLGVRQIDVAPTLATLLGLPLPGPSEGRVLVEALAVDGASRARVVEANRRQLERLVAAVAAHRGIAPRPVRGDDLASVSMWLDGMRARATWVPLAWALALALVAATLAAAGWSARPVWLAWLALALVGVVGALGDGRGTLAPALALAAAIPAALVELRGARWPTRRVPFAIALLITVEGLLALWRLHYRSVEIAELETAARLHLAPELAIALATAIVLVPLALVARRRAWWPTSGWGLLALLVLPSAVGESVALPLAIGLGVVAAIALGRGSELWQLVAAMVAGLVARRLLDHPLVAAAHLSLVGPSLMALIAWGALPGRRATTTALLAALALVGTALGLAGNPPLAFHLFLALALAATGIAASREAPERAWATLGWGAAVLLSLVSSSGQQLGLCAWTLAAHAAGRLRSVADADASPSTDVAVFGPFVLLCVGLRAGFLALYEGALRLSQIDVTAAYTANPGAEHIAGGVLVALKLALPMVLVLGLATAALPVAARARVVAGCAVFWLLVAVHLVFALGTTSGNFFSPYTEAGHLLFALMMVASLALVAALLPLAGRKPAVDVQA